MKKLIELDFNEVWNRPVVYAVYVGTRRFPETHQLYCLCTDKNVAIKRSESYNYQEDYSGTPYGIESVEYWWEELMLDHLYGQSCIEKARELKRKFRSGD